MLLKFLKRKRGVIAAAIIVFTIIIGVGLFFAEEKSEPVYLSKIDKIMFDTKNKSPKFVLTLPERPKFNKQTSPKKAENVETEETTDEAVNNSDANQTFDPVDLLNSIPLVSKLQNCKGNYTQKYVELNDVLVENAGNLKLPKKAPNNKKPWSEYGNRVEVMQNFYKISVLIKDAGLDDSITNAIINALPSEVSISFSPYAHDVKTKILSARSKGHETYTDLPLSSKDFLHSDSGPMAMSISVSQEELINRLQKLVSPGAPIGGITILPGIADEGNKSRITKILEEANNRGLLMIDATKENGISKINVAGLARKKADVIIDFNFNKDAIKAKLEEAEGIAIKNGSVLVIVEPKPIVVTMISDWLKTFSPQLPYEQAKLTVIDKPFALVPVSNTVVE